MAILDRADPRPAAWIQKTAIVLSGVGVFFGFLVGIGTSAGQAVFCGIVGVVGILGFVRHNVTAASDAARLGFANEHRGYQYEVGFANLAFGLSGVVVALANWGPGARIAVLFGFACYLVAVLDYHVQRAFRGELRGGRAVLVLSSTGVLAAMLLIAAGFGAHANNLWPF